MEIDNWTDDGPWDVISCLNVLDRCSRPTDLLRQMHKSLTPGGRVVIALVLPYQPYVEVGEMVMIIYSVCHTEKNIVNIHISSV